MENAQNKNSVFGMMKILMGFLMTAAALFLMAFFLFSCSKDTENARLHIRLTDAPGDYQEVNIDIQGVEVHRKDGAQSSGWKVLNVENGVYNLLELTNGLDTLLATAELPAGSISQIRLILGNNNSVKVDDVVYALSTPSAQQSGLKLNIQAELKAGVLYIITLDFDAALSVVKTGSNTYSLKPVIRALTSATSGAIKGTTTPLDATPAVFAIQGSDTISTCYTDATGKFLLQGVPAGTYVVSFSPAVGYLTQQKENVIVTTGNVTDVGLITIE